ncbi:type II toxin-antitoxin system Phd/YefM family antitoxin [Desulfovibrio piger]|uniref:type II toxin-antitoxin system Phd/YefM family antitoxin n=1 Tax=Desulfovibrio piger TaxID=901 RepID=UPI0039F57CFB
MSQAITYTEARQNLAETMNRVCDHHEPVIITRQKSPSVVLMSLEDYNAIMETAYLLRSPANAARLREALHAADAGKTVQHDKVSPSLSTCVAQLFCLREAALRGRLLLSSSIIFPPPLFSIPVASPTVV